MDPKAEVYKTLTKTLSRVLKTPQYLILFVSDTCWMKCSHCWFSEDWKSNNLDKKRSSLPLVGAPKPRKTYDLLGFDELERLAQSIERITFLTITGGEAFIRDDIVEIAQMFAKRTQLGRYQIPTSGFDTDRIVGHVERILTSIPHIPFRVDVSLDGTEAVHDSIRRIEGGWKRAVATIRALNVLKKKHRHFDVGVITTVSRQNQHEIEAVGQMITEQINPEGEWMVNITRGAPRDPTATEVDPRAYVAAHQLIARRIESGSYRGHTGHIAGPWLTAKNATRRQMIFDTISGKRSGGGCSAGALAAVIDNDGTVRPCELLERDKAFGNLRDFDYDLAALWRSPKADEVRNWIQDSRCICTQECFLSMDILIQPQHWPHLIGQRVKLAQRQNGV